MPYGIETESKPFRNTGRFLYLNNGVAVNEERVIEGSVPLSYVARLGNNNPSNGPLLLYKNMSKPKRLKTYIKKVIIGYKYIYKKVWYTKLIRRRVKVHLYNYDYYKYFDKISRSGRKYQVRKRFVKRVFGYRYYTQHRLLFRKEAIRVPIKVRMVFPVVIPEVVRPSDLPEGTKPYLRNNYLSFTSVKRSVVPWRLESNESVLTNSKSILTSCSSEGIKVSNFGSIFTPYGVSIGKGVAGENSFPPYIPDPDDIYLSATALHGLYVKVNNEIPETLTSLAELPETLRAIQSVLLAGVKLAIQLRKFDLQTVYKSLDKASKRRQDSLSGLSSKIWLAWYLAIKPTILDIGDHINILSREDRVWRVYDKGAANKSSFAIDNPGYGSYIEHKLDFVKWGVIIEGRLTVDEFKDQFTEDGSLSAALYAIVPLSFVADWAVNISEWLASSSIFNGLEYESWKTTGASYDVAERRYDICYQGPTNKANTLPWKYVSRTFKVVRDPNIGPLPDMPLIPWKKQLIDETKINRSLTALSLLRVLGSKRN